jgi:hypothetical protein
MNMDRYIDGDKDMDMDIDTGDMDMDMDMDNYGEMSNLPISHCNAKTSKFKSTLKNICK